MHSKNPIADDITMNQIKEIARTAAADPLLMKIIIVAKISIIRVN